MMQIAPASTSVSAAARSKDLMAPKDLIWLALLGIGSRGAALPETAVQSVLILTRRLWSPSPALINDCLTEMLERGLLAEEDGVVATTATGRQVLMRLMHLGGGNPATAWGQLTVRVRLAFADLLGKGQEHYLHGLVAEWEQCVTSESEMAGTTLPMGEAGRRWWERERQGLHAALSDLRSLASACDGDCANCPCGGAGKTKH